MNKYIKIIVIFLSILLIYTGLNNNSTEICASPIPLIDSGGDGIIDGYPHQYNMGTFGIQSSWGAYVMKVNHYTTADINDNLKMNKVSINYTAYNTFVTIPVITSTQVTDNFSWVKTRTYFTLGATPEYCYGEHGEFKVNATKMF